MNSELYDAHQLYKCAMEIAVASLRNSINLLVKINRKECADILEREIEKINSDIAKREAINDK